MMSIKRERKRCVEHEIWASVEPNSGKAEGQGLDNMQGLGCYDRWVLLNFLQNLTIPLRGILVKKTFPLSIFHTFSHLSSQQSGFRIRKVLAPP